MIRVDCEQGSPEWFEVRCGIPTSSNFHRILTPSGKPSRSQEDYLAELLAEWMLGSVVDQAVTEWMLRGQELEPQARSYYEFQTDQKVEQVGFVLHDRVPTGCSPDGLTSEAGLELKCPSAKIHVLNMLGGLGDKYKCQVQGALWICSGERDVWDLLSFHPELPPALVRIERDEPFIEALSSEVERFCDRLADARETLKRSGYVDKDKPTNDRLIELLRASVQAHEDAILEHQEAQAMEDEHGRIGTTR